MDDSMTLVKNSGKTSLLKKFLEKYWYKIFHYFDLVLFLFQKNSRTEFVTQCRFDNIILWVF